MTVFLDSSADDSQPERDVPPPRIYRVLGVPYRTGSLYPGSEHDAQPYRDVGLIARLPAAGCQAVDDGDLAIPSYLPHHTVPPIRSWPGPRIVWDIVSDALAPHLRRPGHVPLLIGCDCSIVVGAAQALARAGAGDDLHVIYVDGDFDDAPPRADRYQSAAAMALWLLTQPSPFWTGPPVDPARTEAGDLLGVLLQDPRIRVIEVTEYASLRDGDQACARQLADLLASALGAGPR